MTGWHQRIYNDIIYRARLRLSIDGIYYEKHHIIPRSMGGSDSADNIAILTAREHFMCHLLLTKIATGVDREKMLYALSAMAVMKNEYQQRYKINSHTYSYLKKQLAETRSENWKNNNPMHNDLHKQTHANAMKIRVNVGMTDKKHTVETKDKMRQSQLAKGPMSKSIKDKISKTTIQNSLDENYDHCMKGWYITPWGRYKSLSKAAAGMTCTRVSIQNWCKTNNNKIIRKVTYVKNKSIFHETDIGISFSDKGFGYEEIKA